MLHINKCTVCFLHSSHISETIRSAIVRILRLLVDISTIWKIRRDKRIYRTRCRNSVVNAFTNTDFFPRAENTSFSPRGLACSSVFHLSPPEYRSSNNTDWNTAYPQEVTCGIDRAKSSLWIWSSARGEICKFGAPGTSACEYPFYANR